MPQQGMKPIQQLPSQSSHPACAVPGAPASPGTMEDSPGDRRQASVGGDRPPRTFCGTDIASQLLFLRVGKRARTWKHTLSNSEPEAKPEHGNTHPSNLKPKVKPRVAACVSQTEFLPHEMFILWHGQHTCGTASDHICELGPYRPIR